MPRPPLASTQPDWASLTADPGRQWIFGYGSLAHVESLKGLFARHRRALGTHGYGALVGFQHTWSVAMDNSATLPRYKYYLDAKTGARPDVFVAFANIETGEDRVSGILFQADDGMLEVLDARERNYLRTDVTAHLCEPVAGPVWTYVGSPEANARFHHGLKTDALVIDKAYAQAIQSAFAHAGLPYTAPLPRNVPLVELTSRRHLTRVMKPQ